MINNQQITDKSTPFGEKIKQDYAASESLQKPSTAATPVASAPTSTPALSSQIQKGVEIAKQATSSLGNQQEQPSFKQSESQFPMFGENVTVPEIMNKHLEEGQDPEHIKQAHQADSEPYGFDDTDKGTMIGSLFTGEVAGAAEFGAATVQRLLGLEEKIGLVKPGLSDDFTDGFNRTEKRNKLYQDAQASFPTTTHIGKVIGEAVPLVALGEALPEVAGMGMIGSAVRAGKAISNIAKDAVLKDATWSGAAKSLINSAKTITPMTIAKVAGRGAMVGETQYEPENNHYISDGITGAIANLAIEGGGRIAFNIVNSFKSPLAKSIVDIAKQTGLSLPILPAIERFTKDLPFSNYTKYIVERAQKLKDIASGMLTKLTDKTQNVMRVDLTSRAKDVESQIKSFVIPDSDAVATSIGNNEKLLSSIQDHEQNLMQAHDDVDKNLENISDNIRTSNMIGNKESANEYTKQYQAVLEQKKSIKNDLENIQNSKKKLVDQNKDLSVQYSNIKNQSLKKESLQTRLNLMQKQLSNPVLNYKDFLVGKFAQFYRENVDKVEDLNKQNADSLRNAPPSQIYTLKKIAAEINANEKSLPIDAAQDKNLISYTQSILDSPSMTSSQLNEARKAIGEKQEIAQTWSEKSKYKRLYGAASNDQEIQIKNHGDDDALRRHDLQAKIHKENIQPFRNGAFEEFRDDDANSDNLIGKFIQPNKPTKVREMMAHLPQDQASKLAIKAAVFNDAMHEANIPGVGFNPLKLCNHIMKLNETLGQVYSRDELNILKGYTETVNIVNKISADATKAGVAEGLTSVGKEITPRKLETSLAGVAAGAWHPMLIPYLLAATTFSKLITSNSARKLLIKFADMSQKERLTAIHPMIKKLINYTAKGTRAETINTAVELQGE